MSWHFAKGLLVLALFVRPDARMYFQILCYPVQPQWEASNNCRVDRVQNHRTPKTAQNCISDDVQVVCMQLQVCSTVCHMYAGTPIGNFFPFADA